MSTGFRNFMITALVVLLGLSGFSSYMAMQNSSSLQDAQDEISSLTSQLSIAESGISSLQAQVAGVDDSLSNHLDAINAIQAAAAKALPSMVYIQTPSGSGSGVIMAADGYILTNKHVVDGETEAIVITQDRKIYNAVNIWQDSLMDLAVIKINAVNLLAAEFGDTSTLRVGDTIVALGNPLGYSPADFGSTVTAGIVSNLASYWYLEPGYWYPDLIQFDVFITNGNSGGPLINLDGEVIGINSLGEEPGINYAISSATSKRVYDNLKISGASRHPFLGVDVNYFERPVSGQPGVYQLLGAEVWAVVAGSPAAAGGLIPSEVIVAADGEAIGLWSDLARAVFRASPGDTMTLTVERSGVNSTITITLGERPAGVDDFVF